jgi:hypothetical protein
MQQQQQSADYDLMAVFPDEPKAVQATEKLHKAGFKEDEVHQLASGSIGSGQFREHGPNRGRADYFLQKQRSGPNFGLVVGLALIFALILGGLTFVSTLALPNLHVGYIFLIGTAIGLVIGAVIGLLRRGRVRGDIGQKTTAPPPTPKQLQAARNIVALRFADPDNISRKSRARAILINSDGKIDRSVGRRE